ncbi:MAG: hypothetical protein ACREAF_00230 [Nitrosopumilaceae archaeon]
MTESVKRRSKIYSELTKIDDKGTAHSLGALQRAPAPGKKLQKIGWIVFWVPEPTGITHAIGAPMILGGRYLDKVYNSATISDVGHETKNTVGTIKNFKETIS